MKAIRLQTYGGAEQLRFEDVAVPVAKPDEVLVRVMAASVNPWDLKLASGMFKAVIPMPLPYVPGGDFCGVVEAVGREISGMQTGDAVYGNCPAGAYAQYVTARAGGIALKPDAISDEEAAAVPLAGLTAWQALFEHGKLQRGQTVLIHGASGGVGLFAVQFAHWKGAKVIATASGNNVRMVQSLGADTVIDYKTTAFENVVKEVDLVLDLVGGQTQTRSFGVLKPLGMLVATAEPPSQEEAGKHQVKATMMIMQPSTEGLSSIGKLIETGQIKVVVAKIFPLEKAADAWREMKDGHGAGKLVLKVAD